VRRIRGCSAVSLAGVGQYHHCSQQIKRPIGPATPHWSPGRWRLVGSVSVLYLWTPTQKVESEERRSSCASERRTSTCFGPLLTCQHAWSLLWPPSSCRQSFHCPCSGLTAPGFITLPSAQELGDDVCQRRFAIFSQISWNFSLLSLNFPHHCFVEITPGPKLVSTQASGDRIE